ncbi:MAG: VCBS repeat-containing protein [Deltaproteobacteria bacterium]|nr:VCBS repeat-containing protein [Deltaproteobacteria bacterium]MCB9785306.1 VCBS repeat-containing protein [Deltaproteobacteria bacterium]
MSVPLRDSLRLNAVTSALLACLCAALGARPAAAASCGLWYGDADGNFRVDLGDALCIRAAAQAARADAPAPACLASVAAADLDCDGAVTAGDVRFALRQTQELPQPLALDGDGDGCADACEALCPGPACPRNGAIRLERRDARAGLVAWNAPDPQIYPGGQWWMHAGLAVADFDRDGHPDVFAAGGGGAPDHLFINTGEGAFVDQTTLWGLPAGLCIAGAAAADVDGDGFVDLFVTAYGWTQEGARPDGQRFYRNVAGHAFEDATAAFGLDFSVAGLPSPMGAAFGDFDLDGDLDLAVTSWWAAANNPTRGNRLLRNDGADGFVDVTAHAIGALADQIWGFQPAFVDMDGDLLPELLLSADFGTSRYLRNLGHGKFQDTTVSSGLGLDANGMGQAVGDFDGDGRLDWFVSSIHQTVPPSGKNNGNMLYRNLGGHHYAEIALDAGVNDGGWGWGALAVDLDQDGWLDLVQVNGRPSPNGTGEWSGERAKLFRNEGGSFAEVAAWSGLEHTDQGRGLAALDADQDGDLDLLVGTNTGPLHYYENRTPRAGGWLQVALDTRANRLLAPQGFGARIVIAAGGREQVRYVDGAPSFLATSEAVAHFGLAGAATVDRVEVHWPRGQVTRLRDVAAGQRLVVKAPFPADVNADGRVDGADLLLVSQRQGLAKGAAGLAADVDGDGVVGPMDLALVAAAM